MIFGSLPIEDAEGSVLAHSLTVLKGRIKKGTVLGPEECQRLTEAGFNSVLAAQLEPDDVPENTAAERLAVVVAGEGTNRSTPFTGRANLLAATPGIVRIEADAVHRLNAVHESLTLSTVQPDTLVSAGQMVATVKVIPFAVPSAVLNAGLAACAGGIISVTPFQPTVTGLLITELPGDKPGLRDKTITVTQARLARFGASMGMVEICLHDADEIAQALDRIAQVGQGPILIFSSSAVVDRGDVVPSGLVAAGGEIVHFGMPVDPGNLLLVGRLGGRSVLAAPGSARSPRLHGFDWALGRVFAGLPLDGEAIARMGVGGLLKEIPSRPQPRSGVVAAGTRAARRIAVVVLAAGQSRRMGTANKLLAEVHGRPMVVHAVRAALASKAVETVVVTGHQSDDVRAVVGEAPVRLVHNPDHADGLSGSLRTGIAALGNDIDGALILLGDMPGIGAAHVDALIDAFAPEEGRGVCVAASGGKRGNPVLWARGFFPELAALEGDTGARELIRQHADQVVQVELSDAVLVDIDTPEALKRAVSGGLGETSRESTAGNDD